MKEKPPLIVILGYTGSGKTEWGIFLAKKFNGEIICADSRQIYKEMNIGTAKPEIEKEEMIDKEKAKIVKGVPHYLLDILELQKDYSAALFKKDAKRIAKKILKRKKIPFLVGGTYHYIQGMVENFEFPKVPPQKKLREKLSQKTEKELFSIYQKLDPEGAKLIEKENKRRLIRAIEVCTVTKKPFFSQRKKGEREFEVLKIGIKLHPKDLEKRIKKRLDKMLKKGLEKEAKLLFEKYGKIPPLLTIGYKEWFPFFEGKIKKEEAIEQILKNTLDYVKYQRKWFKKDKEIHWCSKIKEAEKLIKNFLKNANKN